MARYFALYLLVTLSILYSIRAEPANDSVTSLRLLHFIFRHGDRSPIELYPNDPNPASSWPQGLGQLSLIGKEQHYKLGKFLQSSYKGFLTGNPREVYAQSSFMDRCLESAQVHLSALYSPPPKDWVWDTSFPWQPIPIQTMPRYYDSMLNPNSYCPASDKESERIESLPSMQRFYEEHKELFSILSEKSGKNITNIVDAAYIFDCLKIEAQYNMTIPDWALPIWSNMSEVYDLAFYFPYQTRRIQKLRAGVLLTTIADNLRSHTKNAEWPDFYTRLYVYSTHDTVLALFMNALDVFNMKAPHYASTIILELHSISGDHFVKLLYFDASDPQKEPQEPAILLLPACGKEELCPLEKFLSILDIFRVEDWDEECRIKSPPQQPFRETIVIVVLAVALVLVILAFVYYFRRTRRREFSSSYVNILSN